MSEGLIKEKTTGKMATDNPEITQIRQRKCRGS